jgi:hypothetical protein
MGLRAVAILIEVGSHAIDHEKYAALDLGGAAGVKIFCIERISDYHAMLGEFRQT